MLEQRNGGFTERGRQLIEQCHRTGIILDVSHLSQAGFWEMAELTQGPVIASHSNAYSICPHPRNLSDEQIRALIALNGMIGITFVPWFIRSGVERVTPEDVLPHIEKICELGGEKHIMFGSDFDGSISGSKGWSTRAGIRIFRSCCSSFIPNRWSRAGCRIMRCVFLNSICLHRRFKR